VLGIPSASVASSRLLTVLGTAEILMGLVAFVLPVPALLPVLMAWKVFLPRSLTSWFTAAAPRSRR
jgi:hypothetical protein